MLASQTKLGPREDKKGPKTENKGAQPKKD